MYSIRKACTVLLAGVLALMTSAAVAQGFEELKGNPAKTGKNANPQIWGPGPANLTWFYPNGIGRPGALVRNNTSTATGRASAGAPFGWTAPLAGEEASFPFLAGRTGGPNDLVVGATTNVPAYEYARSTPSALGSNADPRTAQNPAQLSVFTWTIDPTAENPTTPAGNYQLFVWLPNGPTGPFGGPYFYPNRFFVYEITYGDPAAPKTWIEVVDREFAGQGWVRLGSGGRPTTQLFNYVPGQPLRIRLFNTQWRDIFDNILEDNTVTRGVYADAVMAVPDNGSYTASPIVGQIQTATGTRIQTVAAVNKYAPVTQNGQTVTISNAEVAAFDHANGNVLWRWSPVDNSPNTTSVDNTAAAPTPLWASEAFTNHNGGDYFSAAIQGVEAAADTVTYTPTLEEGDYLVQIYCGGDIPGQLFGHATQVNILQGTAAPVKIPVDQSRPGWITISNQRFHHDPTAGPLRVVITNYSALPSDLGLKAYADAVRFIGGFNSQVTATPVQTRAWINLANGGGRIQKDVVVVAAEDGHVYCLDAEGKGDGTTFAYWTYPSILPTGTPDPNSAPTEDGDSADMPTLGFGLSSPTVAHVDPNTDLLYVGGTNGRVYCINMDGRGDYNLTTNQYGTTSRKWSFPSDFPAIKRPALGMVEGTAFMGSVAYSPINGGTVYVPAMEGRVYALDAIGGTNKTTTSRWEFPTRTTQTLGPVSTTPAIETINGGAATRIYFGTARKDDNSRGQFYSLDAGTGALAWQFEGTAQFPADDFLGGPTTATQAQLGIANDMVFASNQNRFIYGLNADNGTLLWQTDEMNAGVRANLTFTYMDVYNLSGTARTPFPIVMVPTEDGLYTGLFARPADVNVDGLKFAWGSQATSDGITASMAVGYNFLYGADNSGNLAAWSASAGVISPGVPPVQEVIGGNNPATIPFRNAKIAFITRDGYQRLRESVDAAGDVGNATYAQAMAFRRTFASTPAFEWGETVYVMVYDFPWEPQDQNGNPTNPANVVFQFSVEGAQVRQFGVASKKFNEPPAPPPNKEAYAVLAFPIQGSGPSSLPPGSANVQFSLSTAAASANGQPVTVRLNPATSRTSFVVANPLGMTMPDPAGNPDPVNRGWGLNLDPATPERVGNGTRSAGTRDGTRLGSSEGVVGHGQTGTSNFWLTDMSMLTLLKGPGRGLEAVRMNRPELAWQGGAAQVLKAIDQSLYPNYEDLPTNFPNTSLDYPNIGRENLRATKDPNGVAENLIVSSGGVSLFPPAPYDEANVQNRTVHPVTVQLDLDVPKFQPAHNRNFGAGLNDPYFLEIGGATIPSGYRGRINVFVDSNGNGVLDSISGRREAFRSFTTNVAVAVDERLSVTTPTVDLGSLAGGTLYAPDYPGTNSPITASPWANTGGPYPPLVPVTGNLNYASLFRPFDVENPGNVNMLNVRVVKGVVENGVGRPWPIYSNSVDELGWMDASIAVHSDIDTRFGLMPQILLQKPRVGDTAATKLSVNPKRRFNPNIGVLESLLFPAPGPNPGSPRIAVSPPIGLPVGQFSQRMFVVEDTNNDQFVSVTRAANGEIVPLEIMSDPGFDLKFTQREDRGTTDFTKYTTSMLDYPQAPVGQNLTHANLQPTGLRAPSGDMLMAWVSDKPGFNAPRPTDPNTNPSYRIYLGGLDGVAPSSGVGTSPLNDLYQWNKGAPDRWWTQISGPLPAGPFPQYFGGATVIPESVKFGGPALPSRGFVDPVTGAQLNSTIMAFVGTAEVQGPEGRTTESRIMAGRVTGTGNGMFTLDNVSSMPYDPHTAKGRPSVYMLGTDRAVIFYSATGTGEGGIYYTSYTGSGGGNFQFARPKKLDLGSGFESASNPSATSRPYRGAANIGGNGNVVEIAFAAKLRGRPNTEIYYGRMNSDANGPLQPLYMIPRVDEPMTSDSEAGTYRAAGVVWNMRAPIRIDQVLNGIRTNLEDTSVARTTDRATGFIRFKTVLGGEAFIDPSLGTVRFVANTPARGARILLSYQPRFLRISENTAAGNAAPTLLWDDRRAGDVSPYSYWFYSTGGALQLVDANNDGVADAAWPDSSRFFITYSRAAAGAGQAARPMWKSNRIGIQLDYPIATDAGGNIVGLNITPNPNGPIQVDPANGRVYFQASDEDRSFQIQYTGQAAVNTTIAATTTSTATILTEKAEQFVPIDQPVNESAMIPFLDPFDRTPSRPGLIWMYYVSTRAGGPDVYFQSMAPKFSPILKGG